MGNDELIKILVDITKGKLTVIDPTYIYLAALIVVLLLGLGYYLLKFFLEKKIDKLHQKDILKYQNDLDQHNELLKHDLYKAAYNSELFSKSAHEIYPQIYEKLVVAIGETWPMEQTGFATANFDNFTEKELHEMISSMIIPDEFKSEILEKVPNQLEEAFNTYKKHLPLDLANRAIKSIQDAMNEWMKKELYFSKEANTLIRQILTSLKGYAKKNKLRLNPSYASLPKEESSKIQEAEENLEKLKELLFKEMQGKASLSEKNKG